MERRQFHTLRVSDVRRETDRAMSIAFAVPPALRQAYRFTQGQYLTLRAAIDGEELRRPYSICVAPGSGELRICSKKLPGGRFSTFLNDRVKVGDKIQVMEPMGRFHAAIEPHSEKVYVFIAGGSGITPVMSNLLTILEREPKAQVCLLYANRRLADIIFREMLSDLKDRYMTRFRMFHVLSEEIPEQPLLAGMMDEAKVAELVGRLTRPRAVDWFFICGPGPMMEGARAALADLGVADERIKVESFGNRRPAAVAAQSGDGAVAGGEAAEVEIVHHGVRRTVQVAFYGPTILDVAQAARIDAPFACKGGVCCTCRARLIEGEVEMDVVHGLEPDEIAAGYILTCQAHPRSPKLVVDYDG